MIFSCNTLCADETHFTHDFRIFYADYYFLGVPHRPGRPSRFGASSETDISIEYCWGHIGTYLDWTLTNQ
jgi:hypothetical protein